MTDILIRRGEKTQRQTCTEGRQLYEDGDAEREDCFVSMEADTGVMQR